MSKQSCICQSMKTLLKEQCMLAETEFQFICLSKKVDTIPFMLFTAHQNDPFKAFGKCMRTPFFRLEKLDEEICCAVLSLLEAVDMEGYPTDSCDDLFALRKTDCCIIINLKCFCAISPLPVEFVNRPLPIIEPKC
ncbi:CotY/CotZ family spore coat protein [Sporosarcina soli]|uniref:CotY/CotZ family spore coat protein n=1 Tax=Sporosarcina soli TaxID=334736 RepID=A0ABW0TFU8_9BACL